MNNNNNLYLYVFFRTFSGELEVASAKNVILYTTLSNKSLDRDCGLVGLLVVTNFKLTFLTCEKDQVNHINSNEIFHFHQIFARFFFL